MSNILNNLMQQFTQVATQRVENAQAAALAPTGLRLAGIGGPVAGGIAGAIQGLARGDVGAAAKGAALGAIGAAVPPIWIKHLQFFVEQMFLLRWVQHLDKQF